MRYYCLLGILILSIIFLPNAGAQQASWSTLPANISANGPFLWVVESSSNLERVSWKILSPQAVGAFHKVNTGKWSCFFSSDAFSTCGPTPFTSGGQGVVFTWNLFLVPGQQSQDYEMRPTDLTVAGLKNVNPDNSVLAWAIVSGGTGTSNVNYKTYRSDLSLVPGASGISAFEAAQGRYIANIPVLDQGIYYIVFDVTTNNGKSGGTIVPINITSSKPSTASVEFIEADNLEIKKSLSEGTPSKHSFNIRNPLNETQSDLSIESKVSADYLKIELLNSSIKPNSSIEYTASIPGLENDLIIKSSFKIFSLQGAEKKFLKEVPIDVDLKVIKSGNQTAASNETRPIISIDPTLIRVYNALVGNPISKQISIKNVGTGTLGELIHESEGIVVEMELPKSVESNSEAMATVTIKPGSKGDKIGRIVIKSNGGEAAVNLDLKVFEDFKTDISALQTKMDNKIEDLKKQGVKDADKLFAPVKSDLDEAESSNSGGDYFNADIKYREAETKFNSISLALSYKPPASGEGGFPTIFVIIIVVVIAGAAVFILIKKKRKKPAEEDLEEEYDEQDTEENDEGEY